VRSLALVALLAACGGTPTLPGLSAGETTGAGTGGTGDTGTGTTDACDRSSDCDTDGLCVADFVPAATGGLGGERGPAACVPADGCITALDLSRWCFDHQGCCDDLRCRTADGVCEPAGLGVTEGSSSGDIGSTGATDTTSTGTDGSTGGDTTGDTTGGTGGTTGGSSSGG
jgi:hypothetical protein